MPSKLSTALSTCSRLSKSATSMPREAKRRRVPVETSSEAEVVELEVEESARCEKRRRIRDYIVMYGESGELDEECLP